MLPLTPQVWGLEKHCIVCDKVNTLDDNYYLLNKGPYCEDCFAKNLTNLTVAERATKDASDIIDEIHQAAWRGTPLNEDLIPSKDKDLEYMHAFAEAMVRAVYDYSGALQ